MTTTARSLYQLTRLPEVHPRSVAAHALCDAQPHLDLRVSARVPYHSHLGDHEKLRDAYRALVGSRKAVDLGLAVKLAKSYPATLGRVAEVTTSAEVYDRAVQIRAYQRQSAMALLKQMPGVAQAEKLVLRRLMLAQARDLTLSYTQFEESPVVKLWQNLGEIPSWAQPVARCNWFMLWLNLRCSTNKRLVQDELLASADLLNKIIDLCGGAQRAEGLISLLQSGSCRFHPEKLSRILRAVLQYLEHGFRLHPDQKDEQIAKLSWGLFALAQKETFTDSISSQIESLEAKNLEPRSELEQPKTRWFQACEPESVVSSWQMLTLLQWLIVPINTAGLPLIQQIQWQFKAVGANVPSAFNRRFGADPDSLQQAGIDLSKPYVFSVRLDAWQFNEVKDMIVTYLRKMIFQHDLEDGVFRGFEILDFQGERLYGPEITNVSGLSSQSQTSPLISRWKGPF